MDVIVSTSGSTGAPKRVLLTEQANTLLAENDIKDLSITSRSVVALDRWGGAGIQKIYWAKLSGCRLAIYPGHEKVSMREWITEQKVTHLSILASTFRWLASGIYKFPGVEILEVGGEMVDWADVAVARQAFPNAAFINRYSCSEARVICRKHVGVGEKGEGRLPVGWPVREVAIVSPAPGQRGEIVVRSPYMSEGYFNDPELTAVRFRNGSYYTGDLGYWLPNGELMHCGRAECSPNCGDINLHIPAYSPDCQRLTEMTHDERVSKWTLAGG